MSKGQLVITAVVVEGRSKSEVARDYDVSRQWVQQLCRRYAAEGATAFGPRSRRPTPMPERCAPTSKTASFGSAKTSPSEASMRRRIHRRRPPRRRPTTNVPAVSTTGRILTVETAQAEISLSGSRS